MTVGAGDDGWVVDWGERLEAVAGWCGSSKENRRSDN